MNTFPDKVGDPCYKPCSNRAGACPWCGTEGLCCKQNEAINECDGTHVRPHISFKETYPQWDDCETIPNTGGAGQRSAHRCILPPGKLSVYPENAHLCTPRTTDAQRGNILHCTAENSLPLPNF